MAPYAEAGDRSVLFGGNIYIIKEKNKPTVIRIGNNGLLSDLHELFSRNGTDKRTIQGDEMGTVYINGNPTSKRVQIKAVKFK